MDTTPPESERLLMAANLHRLRGELNEAEAMVRAALQREPQDYFAREFLGDLLVQKGDYRGAEAAYRAILQDSPGRAAVEEKLARLILKSAPVAVTTSSGTPLRTDRNPFTVLMLSLLFPGAGHFYLGDRVKGLIFGAVTLILGFASVPALIGSLGPVLSAYSQGLSPEGFAGGGALQGPSAGSLIQMTIIGLLTTVVYIYAAIDAFAAAQRAARSQG